MKLVQHSFEEKDGKCSLTIFPAPSHYYDGVETKPIDGTFSWGLKGYSAKNHPMQLYVDKSGLLSGELDTKSFGMKVLGFGGDIENIELIDYKTGSWSRNKKNTAVRYEETAFGIEYMLNGLALKQTIKINDRNYIKPICEKLYIQK